MTELAHAKYVLESNDIQFIYELKELELEEEVNKELAVILKELITNILKHANADLVKAEVFQRDNETIMIIEDNGIGLASLKNEDQSKQGFGLKGIRERMEKLSGRFTLESNPGAKFTFSVPAQTSEIKS